MEEEVVVHGKLFIILIINLIILAVIKSTTTIRTIIFTVPIKIQEIQIFIIITIIIKILIIIKWNITMVFHL